MPRIDETSVIERGVGLGEHEQGTPAACRHVARTTGRRCHNFKNRHVEDESKHEDISMS